jgi:hypothetical protein
MCDVALVSHRTGTIDCDAIYGLLTECFQDVSFVLLALHLLVTCYLVSNFSPAFESHQKHIVELKEENSRLKATATKLQGLVDNSAQTIVMLQHSVDAGIGDYDPLMEGN